MMKAEDKYTLGMILSTVILWWLFMGRARYSMKGMVGRG